MILVLNLVKYKNLDGLYIFLSLPLQGKVKGKAVLKTENKMD